MIPHCDFEMESTDVIIVGAGLTGLTLARNLTEQGIDFLLLEGRDRIGGRIHSIETQDGAVVEMGATWFFSHFNNLSKLLKKLKVDLTDQYSRGHTMYESDARTPARKINSSGGDMFRIKGGTARIVQKLQDKIDVSRVLLGQKVSEIRQTPDGIEVTSNGKIFKSSRVVTTVPPQLLAKSVKFSPLLPLDVMSIMKSTHTWMGDSIKGAVTYKTPFWKNIGLSGALYSNAGPFVQMYDQTNTDGNGAALVGFLSGSIARVPFEERKKKVIAQLVRVFGDQASEYIEYRDTVWSKEQFTMDSQAARVSQHQNNGHQAYQQPLFGGALIIGGTETSPRSGGYMEGAVNSANKITTMLTK